MFQSQVAHKWKNKSSGEKVIGNFEEKKKLLIVFL